MMRVWLVVVVVVVELHADAHSRVPGHGRRAEGSNERAEGKKREKYRGPRAPSVPWWLGTGRAAFFFF